MDVQISDTFRRRQAAAQRDYENNLANPVEKSNTILQEISRRIRGANIQADLILDRLSMVGERAFGPQPESCNEAVSRDSASTQISPDGAVDQIFIALGNLDATLARLEAAENRIHELA